MSDPRPRSAFVTERLEVRRLTMGDVEAFHTVWGDPAVIFWGAMPDLASSRTKLRQLLDRRGGALVETGWFAVVRRSDGVFVGDVGLEPASWNAGLVEMGWHVAAAHQGKGYASEAAGGLLHHAGRLGMDAVWAKILLGNRPSVRVAMRLGMARAGTLDHAGDRHDLWRKPLA